MIINIICEGMTDEQKQSLLLGIYSYRELGERFRPGVEMSCDGVWYTSTHMEFVYVINQRPTLTIYLDKVVESNADAGV